MMKGRLFIISAPSGTGKSTVVHQILKRRPDLLTSVSCTTRKPREGETEGKDYIFIEKSKFEELIKDNYFAEWAYVHGYMYGTPK